MEREEIVSALQQNLDSAGSSSKSISAEKEHSNLLRITSSKINSRKPTIGT